MKINPKHIFLAGSIAGVVATAAETTATTAATVAEAKWNFTSPSDFESILAGEDLVLAVFSSPYTDDSKSLAQEWARASSLLSGKGVRVVSIDCVAEQALCAEYDIRRWPSIRLFDQGEAATPGGEGSDSDEESSAHLGIRYRGPRRASSIVSFVLRALVPTVSAVNGANIRSLLQLDLQGDTDVFMLYLPSASSPQAEDHSLIRSHFTKLAEKYRFDYVFGISEDAQLAEQEIQHQEEGELRHPTLIAYKPFVNDREVFTLDEPLSSDTLLEIENFITGVGEPLVGELTRQNEQAYLQGIRLLVYIFVTSDEQRLYFRRTLYPLAKQYSDYLAFVNIDAEEYGHMAASLGLRRGVFPSLTVYSSWKDQVFPFPGEQLDIGDGQVFQAVEDFVLEILQGKLEPWTVEGSGGDELQQEAAAQEQHHDEL